MSGIVVFTSIVNLKPILNLKPIVNCLKQFYNLSCLFSPRFGKFIRHPVMSQLSTASTTTNGTPSGPPMSQETFEYLWNTLGEVTENG